MKYLNLVSPLVLVIIALISVVTATSVTGSAAGGMTKTKLQPGQEPGDEPVKWEFPDDTVSLPPIDFQNVINLATNLFGVQLVGAYSRQQQLDALCFNFDPTRLNAQGYNITLLHNIFCEAGAATQVGGGDPFVPNTPYIQNLTRFFSTYIWIFQAFGAMNNDPTRLQVLCELITPEFSFKSGLDFDLVKLRICDGAKGTGLPSVGGLALPFEDLKKERAGSNGGNGNANANGTIVKRGLNAGGARKE
ncbi:MAG: hypothetical protein Q9174_000733 [Haloplaca sp. 1 TL-2023]